MMISEVMTRDVRIVSPDDTLESAARLMEEEDFGSLPVAENDRLVGIVSLGDLALTKPTNAGDALQAIADAPASALA